MASKLDEKRNQPRVMVRALVDYESNGTYLYDYSNDLSEGGIFIETDNPLPQGSELTLRFTLPDVDRVFEIKGVVAWVNGVDNKSKKMLMGMGVEFTNMEGDDKSTLDEYIKKLTNAA